VVIAPTRESRVAGVALPVMVVVFAVVAAVGYFGGIWKLSWIGGPPSQPGSIARVVRRGGEGEPSRPLVLEAGVAPGTVRLQPSVPLDGDARRWATPAPSAPWSVRAQPT